MAKETVTLAQVLAFQQTADVQLVEAAQMIGERTLAERSGQKAERVARMAKARAAKGKGRNAAAGANSQAAPAEQAAEAVA
jgi:hypothetical protein